MSEPVDGTYEPDEQSIIHRMRGAIGDRGPVFLIPDETYEARLAASGNWLLGAASIADTLGREFASRPDSFSESGEVSVSWRQRADGFFTIARNLRAQAAATDNVTNRGLRIRRPRRSDRIASGYEFRKSSDQHGGVFFDD